MIIAIFILSLLTFLAKGQASVGTIMILTAYALFAPWVYITLIVIVSIVAIIKALD